MMTKDQKLEDEEFDELIEIYKGHVDDNLNRRVRKLTILWSFISSFYVLGGLHLNVAHTGNEEEADAIVWGILITGITESKFLIFLFIVSAYFMANFLFSIWKLHRQLNIIRLFKHFWSLRKDELTTAFSISTKPSYADFRHREALDEAHKEALREGKFGNIERKLKDTKQKQPIAANRKRYDIRLFIYYYRFVGSLEYFIVPVIFPMILGICAISVLAVEWFF